MKKVDRMECATFDRILFFSSFLFSFSFLNSQHISTFLPRANLSSVEFESSQPIDLSRTILLRGYQTKLDEKIMAMGQNRKNKNEIVSIAKSQTQQFIVNHANGKGERKNVLWLRQFIKIYLNRPGWQLDGVYALWIRCEMRSRIFHFKLIVNFFTFHFPSSPTVERSLSFVVIASSSFHNNNEWTRSFFPFTRTLREPVDFSCKSYSHHVSCI